MAVTQLRVRGYNFSYLVLQNCHLCRTTQICSSKMVQIWAAQVTPDWPGQGLGSGLNFPSQFHCSPRHNPPTLPLPPNIPIPPSYYPLQPYTSHPAGAILWVLGATEVGSGSRSQHTSICWLSQLWSCYKCVFVTLLCWHKGIVPAQQALRVEQDEGIANQDFCSLNHPSAMDSA